MKEDLKKESLLHINMNSKWLIINIKSVNISERVISIL